MAGAIYNVAVVTGAIYKYTVVMETFSTYNVVTGAIYKFTDVMETFIYCCDKGNIYSYCCDGRHIYSYC